MMLRNFLFMAIIATILMIILFAFYFNKRQTIKRKLKKAIAKNISDFHSGEIAKIVGKVEIIGEPLLSPLSNRECAYYHVLIERKVSSGRSTHWKILIEEEIAGRFLIKDGRHFAYVNGKIVKSYIVQDRIYRSGFLKDATDNLEKYLLSHGETSEGILGLNKTIRYKEGVLENGEMIAVIGKGEWKNAGQENLPEHYGRILTITSTDDQPIYLSDDPDTVANKNNQIQL